MSYQHAGQTRTLRTADPRLPTSLVACPVHALIVLLVADSHRFGRPANAIIIGPQVLTLLVLATPRSRRNTTPPPLLAV